MGKDSNDQPAFPVFDGGHNRVNEGMELRDWFAGQWIGGAAADPGVSWNETGTLDMVKKSYEVADAMMKARERESSDRGSSK